MKRLHKGPVVAVVLLGVLILAGGALSMNQEAYCETFSVKPGTVLKVININGDISVSSWDRDCIEIKAFVRRHWWTGLVKEPTIDVATGPELVIRTLCSTAFSKAMIPVCYQIRVPKTALTAHVQTSVGKLHLEGTSGDVDARTSAGEIRVQGVDGSIKAITTAGMISVDEVSGQVDVKTSSGEIHIRKAGGFVRAASSNGRISIAGSGGLSGVRSNNGSISVEVPAIRDNAEIRSINGSITVFLSPTMAVQLKASTTNGQVIYTDLPLNVNECSRTKLAAKLGEGGGALDILTFNGTICLKRLGG